MDRRVELNWLLDFYGALLTDKMRETLRLYLEEDMSLQEIADALSVTRQAAHDAISKAEDRLSEYERKLGLLERYKAVMKAVAVCRAELESAQPELIKRAIEALDSIESIER